MKQHVHAHHAKAASKHTYSSWADPTDSMLPSLLWMWFWSEILNVDKHVLVGRYCLFGDTVNTARCCPNPPPHHPFLPPPLLHIQFPFNSTPETLPSYPVLFATNLKHVSQWMGHCQCWARVSAIDCSWKRDWIPNPLQPCPIISVICMFYGITDPEAGFGDPLFGGHWWGLRAIAEHSFCPTPLHYRLTFLSFLPFHPPNLSPMQCIWLQHWCTIMVTHLPPILT